MENVIYGAGSILMGSVAKSKSETKPATSPDNNIENAYNILSTEESTPDVIASTTKGKIC